MPSAVTAAPGVTFAAARALAEYSQDPPLYPDEVVWPSEEMPIVSKYGHSSPGLATSTPAAVVGSDVPALSLGANDTEYVPSVCPAVTVTSALADDPAGTVSEPLVGLTVIPLEAVAVQVADRALLVRLVTVSEAVPVDPGAMIRPLAGPAEASAVCSPVASEGGASLAPLAQDLFGVVDRLYVSVPPEDSVE